MTRLQEVLWRVESDYHGHPYYVSGHAVYTAIARDADAETRRGLAASHGVFLPGEWGRTPSRHLDQRSLGKAATGLRGVRAYEDLWVYRDVAHRWLLPESPRDAHNALPVRTHGGRLAIAPTEHYGRPAEYRNHKRSVEWLIHAFLHTEGECARDETRGGSGRGVLPVGEDVLDGLQFGGARNYGFGEVSLVDTQVIDLEAIEYAWLRGTEDHHLEVVSPYVLWSEYPGADDQSIPEWWDLDVGPAGRPAADATASGSGSLRRRRGRLYEDGEEYALGLVDHGQVVGYAGDRPVETAKNGLTRVGTHARFGFGELRVVPAGRDRVPERYEALRALASWGE